MEQANIEKDFLSPKNLWGIFRNHLPFFALSVIACMLLAALYIATKQPVFTRSAQILIKEDNESSSLASDLSGLNIFNPTSNIYNEIYILKSPDLMKLVVERLDLNDIYIQKKFIRKIDLYGDSIPFRIETKDVDTDFSFRVTVDENGMLTLSKFKKNDKKVDGDPIECNVNQTVNTPVGEVSIVATPKFAAKERPYTILYSHRNPYSYALTLSRKVNITNENTRSNIISLTIKDVSRQRGDEILGTLIDVYNESWKTDKNLIAENTSKFITARLMAIENELGHVDTDISQYKSSNLLPDVSEASSMYMSKANAASSAILEINNQLYMARYVRDFLKSMKGYQTLPTNSGFESAALSQQIAKFNDLVLQRNSIVAVSSDSNPVVMDMDFTLRDMRHAIESAIGNQIVLLEKELKSQENKQEEAVGHIASNPEQAKYLLTVERQQKVKESLYLYLLQKLEENELTQSYSVYNNRVILKPNGERKPSSPRKPMIFTVAFIFGFLFPYAWYFFKGMMITTVQSREELSTLNLPLLGSIPYASNLHNKSIIDRILNRKKGDEEDYTLLVQRGNRNMLNESFRILRTNLEMIAGRNSKGNIIVVTSFNPGSGKSFITTNLAATLAFKGKKVLVIDGDMRHGSASQYVNNPRIGLVDYLSGNLDDPSKIIFHSPEVHDFDVIPVGKIPPNPTELLENGRFDTLLNRLKDIYDFILIDCPPVDIVADTQILENYADFTIFIVRIGLLDRSRISELKALYKEKRLKNMTLVINGVLARSSHYYNEGNSSHYYVNE